MKNYAVDYNVILTKPRPMLRELISFGVSVRLQVFPIFLQNLLWLIEDIFYHFRETLS